MAPPRPSPATRARARLHPLVPLIVLVALGVGAYWNGLSAPLIWDDDPAIVTNQTIRSVLPLSDSLSPPIETSVAGRPIANLSLALSYAMGGLDERGYHWWNLAVLIASASCCSASCGGRSWLSRSVRLQPGLQAWQDAT